MSNRDRSVGAVVLGAGYNGLGVVRNLGRRGIPSIVIDAAPRIAWYSRYVRRSYRWQGAMDSPKLTDFLLALAEREGLRGWVLIACMDENVELVARHHAQLSEMYRVATPGWEVVRWAIDKRLTNQLAQGAGVAHPRTWYASSVEQLAELDLRYPVIIKPANSVRITSTLRVKALLANNLEELRAQFAVAQTVALPAELMIQENIPGAGQHQYSIAAYCRQGCIVAAMTARRARQYPIDFGLSSSYVQAVEVPELLEIGERLVASMDVTGLLEIEFKYDVRDAQYKLLDINLRPWAWHSLCPACGLDFSYIQYADLLGLPLGSTSPTYGAHWLRMLTDLPAGYQQIRAGLTTPGAYLRSLVGKTVFAAFEWRDPLPALGDLFDATKRNLTMPRRYRMPETDRIREPASFSLARDSDLVAAGQNESVVPH